MARGDDIQERMINFAVMIIQLCAKLPTNMPGKHVAGQLLRSGTSPAPNYAEGRGAESKNDFIHKLKIVLKELNETHVWLVIIQKSSLLKHEEVASLIQETIELSRIITASIKTAISRKPG